MDLISNKVPYVLIKFDLFKFVSDLYVSKLVKIYWKPLIDEEFRIVGQISKVTNITKKYCSPQNSASFQLRQTPIMLASYFKRNEEKP